LLLTHRSTIATDRAALRFINQGLGASRTTVLFDEAPGNAPSAGLAPFVWTFDSRQLASWGYGTIGDTLIPGHAQFPLLRYFEQHPHFDWYWFVEDDVAYTGRWDEFFRAFEGDAADLLTCHLRPRSSEPRWYWWHTLQAPAECTVVSEPLRALLVVARYSRRALETFSRYCRSGWQGHAEVLAPTVMKQAGLTIADIGGDGPFTPRGRKGKYYSSYGNVAGSLKHIGSLRYRPARTSPGLRPRRLYHPVKIDQEVEQLRPGTRVEAVIRSYRQYLAWRRAQDGIAEVARPLQTNRGPRDPDRG
jgi:hypothetical protein